MRKPSHAPAVAQVVVPRTSDIGGFEVARALPSRERRTVGPFVFLDQMGPSTLPPGQGIDVRPHPHIGLATVTYLFEGEITHRDSLGCVQPIRPGEVNWMTAGHGIVHSERTPDGVRASGGPLAGMQAWVALPREHEETAPAFVHHDVTSLPVIEGDGTWTRLIAGELMGQRSPVETLSETLYADVRLEAGHVLAIPADCEERAVYFCSGNVRIDGQAYDPGRLAVLQPGRVVDVAAITPARMMLLGGAPLDGPRHVWWNFVSSRRERIEQAKADWKAGRFDPVPGETEFIPLPE